MEKHKGEDTAVESDRWHTRAAGHVTIHRRSDGNHPAMEGHKLFSEGYTGVRSFTFFPLFRETTIPSMKAKLMLTHLLSPASSASVPPNPPWK